MLYADNKRKRSLDNQGSLSDVNTLVRKGSVVGVYIPNINRPMPVIGTTTSNNVNNIGLCQTEQSQTATVINCPSGSNEPQKMLHVQAIIGGNKVTMHT